MRLVLMASRSPVSVAIARALVERRGDELVGIVEECTPPRSIGQIVRKFRRIAKRRGWTHALARLFSQPLHRWYDARRDRWLTAHLLNGDPVVWPDGVPVVRVSSVNSPECRAQVRKWRPDVVVISGTTILRPETIALARIATLNMHHGMLPEIRGVSSILWGLIEDRPEWVGVTVHLVAPEVDAGAILAQERVRIFPIDGEVSLFARATRKGIRLLNAVLDVYARGETPQPIDRSGTPSAYRSVPTFWDFLRLIRRRGHLIPLPEAAHLSDE